jgi:hypothetical protein
MSPLVRTPNQCCINKAIQHLSFDPSLQDSAWQKAQARPKPYQTADRDRCSRKTEKGDVICDAGVLDVLDTLGVSLDPTARTVATKREPPVKREPSPTDSLDHLTHKNLYIPGKQSKVRLILAPRFWTSPLTASIEPNFVCRILETEPWSQSGANGTPSFHTPQWSKGRLRLIDDFNSWPK